MERKNCIVCDSDKLNEIIDLGMHPFADTFIPESRRSEYDVVYPLVCDLCGNCGHVQTRYETDPKERYSKMDYSYTSSNSAFSREHWNDYEKEISEELKLSPNSLVLEIGSNDGYLSEQFLKKGCKVLGVDPSSYMAELAEQRGVKTIVGLFGNEISKQILKEYEKVDLVIANNVFNHAENPVEFVKSVAEVLDESGSFVFEQPYWLIGVKSGKFDQIYHEHVSYFSVRSASMLLKRAGMKIKSARIVDYHGGSLRIIAQKDEKIKEESEESKRMIKEEENSGIFNLEIYKTFMKKNIKQRSKFMQEVHKLKENGNSIIAVGAAAKGNTFLNFYGLDNSIIDYVTDASPHKKGKYTPATRIPIVGDEVFSKYDKVYALILSWNIAEQLKEKLNLLNKNIEFLVPEEK